MGIVLSAILAGCSSQQKVVDLYVDAVMLKELDQNQMAIAKLDAAVKLNKKFSLAYSLKADIYQQMKDYEQSAAAYEKAVELNPWSFNDFFNLGTVYKAMKKSAEAAKVYSKACKLKPNHIEANIAAAESYYELKDYDNALIYGRRAEQLDPNVPQIRKMLGDIYAAQKDFEQAIRSYQQALEINSRDTSIMTSLAVCYLKTSRDEPAEKLLNSVVRIAPDNGTAYQYLGYCCLRLYEKAAEAYKKQKQSGGAGAASAETIASDVNAFLDRAVANYDNAVEINHKDWEAYRGLGVAYMLKAIRDGNETMKGKAIAQWRQSLDIEPSQPRCEKLRALIEKYSE